MTLGIWYRWQKKIDYSTAFYTWCLLICFVYQKKNRNEMDFPLGEKHGLCKANIQFLSTKDVHREDILDKYSL